MQIWDTVGQEAYRSINRLYYKGCSACVLVYDLSKPQTLESLEGWLSEFLDNFQDAEQQEDPSQISFIVLGNKLDKLQLDEPEDSGSFRKPERGTSDTGIDYKEISDEMRMHQSYDDRGGGELIKFDVMLQQKQAIVEAEKQLLDWCMR